jgi:hypothetical protein
MVVPSWDWGIDLFRQVVRGKNSAEGCVIIDDRMSPIRRYQADASRIALFCAVAKSTPVR